MLAAAAIASAKNNETHSLLFCSSCTVPPSIGLGFRVIATPKIVFGDDVHASAGKLQQNIYAESKCTVTNCILHINCFRIGRKCLLRRSVLVQTHHQSEAFSYKISTFCSVDSNSAFCFSLVCSKRTLRLTIVTSSSDMGLGMSKAANVTKFA